MSIIYQMIRSGDLLLSPEENPLRTDLGTRIRSGLTGASSVIYVTDGRSHMIADTGFELEGNRNPAWAHKNHRKLERLLGENGLDPSVIDIVFLTHWHRDHFGNLSVFPNARILSSLDFGKEPRFLEYLRAVERIDIRRLETVQDGDFILSGVQVLATPGHTAHHASLLLDTEQGPVAVAGDCILDESTFRRKQIWRHNSDFYSIESAITSIDTLVSRAGTILPGHGTPFSP